MSLLGQEDEGMETGTFTGDGTKYVTIPTSKKCSKLAIWPETPDEITDAYHNITLLAVEGWGFSCGHVRYDGAGVAGATYLESSYSIEVSDTMKSYVIFEDANIEVAAKAAGVTAQVFTNGVTYNWAAW